MFFCGWSLYLTIWWTYCLVCHEATSQLHRMRRSSSSIHNVTKSQVSQPTIQTNPFKMIYPHFPEALAPRTRLIPIRNKYVVISPDKQEINKMGTGKPDIFVMMYYRTDNTAEITVRRLDVDRWTFDVQIRIFSVTSEVATNNSTNITSNNSLMANSSVTAMSSNVEDESEVIIIANPGNTSSVLHLPYRLTKVTLVPLSEADLYGPQKIPRIIMQTYYTVNATNIYHWNAFQTFVDLNPEYEVLLMLDKRCRIFIKKHFPLYVLRAYDALVPKAFKADLFRYCYLYIKGGCYFDNKMINRVPLRRTILPNDDFLVCSDTLSFGKPAKTVKETSRFYNAVICAAPRDERMLRTIKQVVYTVNSGYYRLSDLALTGPVAFHEAVIELVGEENLRFQHEMGRHPYIAPWSPEGHSVGRQYRDYYVREKMHGEVILTKFFQGYYASALRRYGDLWNQGKVYYDPIVQTWTYKKASSSTDKDSSNLGSSSKTPLQLRLYTEPGILPYYYVYFDTADGSVIVEQRSILWGYLLDPLIWYPFVVEEMKGWVRKYIIKYGSGGLTDKIELKLVDEESCDEYYLSLDVPNAQRPKTVFHTQKELKLILT